MSQTAFADAIGVTLSTVWRWEHQHASVPRWAIISVEKLLEDKARAA